MRVGRHDGDRVAVGGRPPDGYRRPPRDARASAGQPSGVEAAFDGHGHHRRIREVPITVLERELGGLDDDVDVVGIIEVGDVETVEQREDGEGGEALGRGREARRLAVAVAHAQGLDPVGAMLGEIPQRQRAADGVSAGHDAAGEIATIELLVAAFGHRGQRSGEVGLDEATVSEPIRVVDGPERAPDFGRSAGGKERVSAGSDAALARRHGEAIACMSHGVLEEPLPRNR